MIRVELQDENGNAVSEGINVPASLVDHPDDPRFKCLCFVDPYGDTIFNRFQLDSLLDDIRLVKNSFPEAACQYALQLQEIENLIARCRKEPHLYVKLIGD